MEPKHSPQPRPPRMRLLLECPTTVAVQAVPIDATVHCRNRIAEFQDLLQQTIQVTYTFLLQQVPCLWRACGHPARHIAPHHFVTASTSMTATCSRVWQETEGTDKHTLRLWLVGAASRLPNVDALRVWRRVECLLPSGGHCDQLSKTSCLQLLKLVCEVDPAKVTSQKACAHASPVLANFAAQCSGQAAGPSGHPGNYHAARGLFCHQICPIQQVDFIKGCVTDNCSVQMHFIHRQAQHVSIRLIFHHFCWWPLS